MVKFFHQVEKSDITRGFIPIGKPIKGAKALVLDDQQRVCPPGVAGEIYIRTPFRTLGYYKDDDATREAFVKNPFNNDPNDLIYRSGDLGLILNDGNFRFLGRKDNQVKIRGIRVELEEIENHLLNHPLVSTAVVLAREDTPGDMRLVAYVVAQQTPGLSSNELRGFLKQKLPDFMMPSAFVRLDALPLTANGKVDRKALPAPDQTQPNLDDDIIEPRTEVEENIATVWRDILRVEKLGIHDNFFDLGGHSLLATQVISRMRNLFQLDLPLRLLFERPTIEELSLTIEEALIDEIESQTEDPRQ
jgi:acyl carrier protein